ncbi:MAG: hypothetical protein PHP54_03425 [Clostridia bacterium]|nr:hypothetical protein [Clostridia bacterium]
MKEKKTNKTRNTKKMILLAVIAVVVIALVVFATIFLLTFKERQTEKLNEEKMNTYGFNKLYDNTSAKSTEKVTKSEAIKVMIGMLLDKADISDMATTETYSNEKWVVYAKDKNIVSNNEITAENETQGIAYIDVIRYLSKAKNTLLDETYGKVKDVKIKDMEAYSDVEQKAVRDLLANGIIKNTSTKLNGNKDITKGKLNELIINAYEKYNITDITGGVIETDENNLPSNKADYPYILKDIPKEIYEAQFTVDTVDKAKNPKEAYGLIKNKYAAIKSGVENYYKAILNVDYNTITEEGFKNQINDFIVGLYDDNTVKEYVEYVKSNKIQLAGKATVQLPIVYYNGFSYRARTKIEFEIKNSDTDKNILFMDIADTKYEGNTITCYADVALGLVFNNDNVYVNQKPLLNILLKDKNYGINLLESEGK